jgi:hypothetical protein
MNRKSSLLLMGSLALASLSCANAANEFRISKFYPIGPGCNISDFKDDAISPNAYLDVAAGAPSLVVGMVLTGAERVRQQEILIGQTTLESETRNRPLVTSMVVNYRLSKRVGGTPRPYVQVMSLPFSDDGEIFGPFQVLSPELGQALFDGLLPSPGTAPSNTIEDFVDIQVDVEFRGEWSATRNTFTTGVLTYPVRAYRSNPVACPSDAQGVLPYVKYDADPTTGEADICSYVGSNSYQIAQPSVPVCCTARGSAGGAGC